MGMFTKGQEKRAANVYEEVRQYLKQKDGALHVVMINSFSKWGNAAFGCDDKYTTQIDYILHCMQREGYQIVDIKFNSLQNQGAIGSLEGFNTLIMYK